jgi:D-glycero-D-manno-heptose 1,7-bisphosphate phosphatase
MQGIVNRRPAIFLDKDGTLTPDIPFNVDPLLIDLAPCAPEGLSLLADAGYQLVVISNQSGVARGYFAEGDLAAVERRICELLAKHGLALEGFYFCPHHPQGVVPEHSISCDCRKPRPGLLLQAANELNLDLAASWMIGDILDDIEAGHSAGCRAALLLNGGERQWHLTSLRRPELYADDLADAADKILKFRYRVDAEAISAAFDREGSHVGTP